MFGPFWLHFVLSPRDEAADALDPYEFYDAVERGRREQLASSLAPHLRLLRRDGVPHVVRKASPGSAGGSIFVPIPGSSFTFELMGANGLENEDAPAWDACARGRT